MHSVNGLLSVDDVLPLVKSPTRMLHLHSPGTATSLYRGVLARPGKSEAEVQSRPRPNAMRHGTDGRTDGRKDSRTERNS